MQLKSGLDMSIKNRESLEVCDGQQPFNMRIADSQGVKIRILNPSGALGKFSTNSGWPALTLDIN